MTDNLNEPVTPADALRSSEKRADSTHAHASPTEDSTANQLVEDQSQLTNLGAHPPQEVTQVRAGDVFAGRYHLINVIGEGGMGEVWLAEQKLPIKRLVAVKLVKAGLNTLNLVERFEVERQTLAMLDHPNISRVLDAGVTDSDQSFFVMEFVNGNPITEYCDNQKLNVRDRLRLFVSVCSAIEHAHQRGIIHRDIKPSNVLVTSLDGQPVCKVIDFGIAKATGAAANLANFNTGCGLVGTPAYMSPEQASLNQDQVDTRSDVYSLGVLLYELLVGRTPFAQHDTKSSEVIDVLQQIRKEDPPRPSHKLVVDRESSQIAAKRDTTPTTLKVSLRSELDWVLLRALERDRTKRYGSATALMAEIDRYLRGAAIHAHPPSRIYSTGKFLKRHRVAASALFLSVSALVAGVIGLAYGYHRQVEQTKTLAAQRTFLRENNALLASIFDSVANYSSAEDGIDLNTVIRSRVKGIASQLSSMPLDKESQLDALELRLRIANAASAIGEYHESRLMTEKVLQDAKAFGLPSIEIAARVKLSELATTFQRDLRLSYGTTEYCDATAALARQQLGENALLTYQAERIAAFTILNRENFYEARSRLINLRTRQEANLDPKHPEALAALSLLGSAQQELFLIPDAISCHKECLNRLGWNLEENKRGEFSPLLLSCLMRLARCYVLRDDLNSARKCENLIQAVCIEHLGSEHATSLKYSIGIIARMIIRGEGEQVLKLCDSILPSVERKFSSQSIEAASVHGYRGRALALAGRWPDALKDFQVAYDLSKAIQGEFDGQTSYYLWYVVQSENAINGNTLADTKIISAYDAAKEKFGESSKEATFLKNLLSHEQNYLPDLQFKAQQDYGLDWCFENLALANDEEEFPKVSCSFVSPFDDVSRVNDGVIDFRLSPNNRWTAFQSPNAVDWIQIDFGKPTTLNHLAVYVYGDDGVFAPKSIQVKVLNGSSWEPTNVLNRDPAIPAAHMPNLIEIASVTTSSIRVEFEHEQARRSGVTEIFVANADSSDWLAQPSKGDMRWKERVNRILATEDSFSEEPFVEVIQYANALTRSNRLADLDALARTWFQSAKDDEERGLVLDFLYIAGDFYFEQKREPELYTIFSLIAELGENNEYLRETATIARSMLLAIEPRITEEDPVSLNNKLLELWSREYSYPTERYNLICGTVLNQVRYLDTFERSEEAELIHQELLEKAISELIFLLDTGEIEYEFVEADVDLNFIKSHPRIEFWGIE